MPSATGTTSGTETWLPPRAASCELVAQAKDYVYAVTHARPPSDMKRLSERISSAMCHYFANLSDEKVNAFVALDWIESLREFPFAAVHKAFADWRNFSAKKPTPADIRALSIDAYGKKEWHYLQRSKHIAGMAPSEKTILNGIQRRAEEKPWKPPTPEERENVARVMADLKKTLAGAPPPATKGKP